MQPRQYLSLAILLLHAGIIRARPADGEPVNTPTTGEQAAGWCLLWDGKTTTGQVVAQAGDYRLRVRAVDSYGVETIRDGNIRVVN